MSLEDLRPIYFPNEINVDSELFYPISSVSKSIKCMSGYFTSGVLAELAQSIMCYLKSNQSGIKFIISPNLTEEDLKVLIDAQNADEDILEKLFPKYSVEEDNLRTKTLETFFYLLVSKKIELKVALLNKGMFHTKAWIFDTESGLATIHGSGNATISGLSLNFEQLTLSRSWKGGDAKQTCEDLESRFEQIWNDKYSGIHTFPLNKKTLESIQKFTNKKNALDNDQLIKDLQELYEVYLDDLRVQNFSVQRLSIPSYLKYEEGDYKHQGMAVNSWFENKGKGILAIATGGGKTLTSLIAAGRLNAQLDNLYLVIAVPTLALLNQWAEDVYKFGVTPINSFGVPKARLKNSINESIRKIKSETSKCEVLIITHDALKSELMNLFEGWSEKINFMLIGDEVHNLGSKGFIANPPNFFKYKLGLSATHERQFDELGSNFLVEYFGDVVYEFSLEEAIGNCLVPYDYHVYKVFLTAEEEDDFKELTFKIKKLSYAANLPDGDSDKAKWSNLCLQRRRLIETAYNKISKFKEVFDLAKNEKKIEKTLIFCTDKNNEQITEINNYLNSLSINWHQVTSEETGNPKLLSSIVSEFKNNEYQVLTAMRVLDEGFNIPQTETAYLLSSNTVRRQWVQRLGRVLRLSPDTDKKKAVLHDFLVLPIVDTAKIDKDLKALIKSECNRVLFFSGLSSNFMNESGTFQYIKEMLNSLETADEYSD